MHYPFKLFHDGSPYHIETSPLICRANHWTGFYRIRISDMKDLSHGFFVIQDIVIEDMIIPYNGKWGAKLFKFTVKCHKISNKSKNHYPFWKSCHQVIVVTLKEIYNWFKIKFCSRSTYVEVYSTFKSATGNLPVKTIAF